MDLNLVSPLLPSLTDLNLSFVLVTCDGAVSYAHHFVIIINV